MKSLTSLGVATFVFAAAALFILGCSDDLGQPRDGPYIDRHEFYKSLAEKENIIYNLMLCYKQHDKDRFVELLHDNYIWYSQPGETPEFYDRATDIDKTGNMFLAAEHNYSNPKLWIDKLELRIAQPGTWTSIVDFNSEPCEDCWETTREYYLVLVMAGGEVTYVANDLVKFVVVPVDVSGKKIYKIIRCDDLPRPY